MGICCFYFIYIYFGGGLRYVNKELAMSLNIGTFEVIFSTNMQEAIGVMSSKLIIHFIVGAIVGLIFIFIRFKYIKRASWYNILVLFIISLVLLAIAKIPEDHMKTLKNNYNAKAIDTTGRDFDIMPEKIYENFYHLIRNRIIFNYQLYKREQYTTVKDVTYDNKSDEKIVILILTDALRPDHMSINGYHRDTTPLMKKNGFISFNDMYACDTATTRSVPCLLTRMKRKTDMYAYLDEPSLFNMFNSANFYTAWFSAQGFISTADRGQAIIARDAKYNLFEKEYSVGIDRDLYKYIDEVLNYDYKNKFFIIQLNGSHWDYNVRFKKEDAKYLPLCNQFALDCPVENLVNSYDNTINETDRFVNGIIERVKDKNAVVYFTSDHGQFLGEGGLRLHSHNRLQYKEVGVIPFAVWFSESAKKDVDLSIIEKNKNKISTHDAVFHSIVGCSGIKSSMVNDEENICSEKFIEAPNEFENYISKPLE